MKKLPRFLILLSCRWGLHAVLVKVASNEALSLFCWKKGIFCSIPSIS